MSISMGWYGPDSHTIAESIAELVHELGNETLGRLRDERGLPPNDAVVFQPDLALWWRCSRSGAEPASRVAPPRMRPARRSVRHPHSRHRHAAV